MRAETIGWNAKRGVVAMLAAVIALGEMLVPAQAGQLSPQVAQLYTSVSINPPTASGMTVCYGFVCRRRHELAFGPGDRAALTRIMAAGKASAAAERKAVQTAVVWLDRRLGPVLGTDKRIARADFRYFDDKHNYDCWDTTRNTTSLLLVMQEWGLLKYHSVGDPKYRGNVLVLQTPHNTAVLVERGSGAEWVVDMWTRAYAQTPEVMPVDQWVKLD